MATLDIQAIREKMRQAIETQYARYRYDRVRCPSVAKMIEYIKIVFPDLKVETESWATHKDRDIAGSRLRNPGIREYTGQRVRIYSRDGNRLFDFNTTDTYWYNAQLATWILWREENLDKIRKLQAQGWIECDGFNAKNWSLDGDKWYRLVDVEPKND